MYLCRPSSQPKTQDSSVPAVGAHPHSMTVVVQNLECVLRGGRQVSWCRRSFDARDCAQVLVDRPQLMVRHILVIRPRHDLQQVPVEGWW